MIAETGAGQHGVAAATVAARFGMECVVYMGSEDVRRQAQNVFRMKLLGATVVPVESGSKTLKDALNEAMRDWVTNVETTFYIIGTVAGPHPYPMMVRDFQSVIGRECLTQMPEAAGRQPDAVIACVGGGSNAMGIFHPYIPHASVRLIGVEAAGEGIATGQHAASLTAGRPGVLHGNRTYLLQDADGQIVETHSVSAGLDYPGVGPEHAWLKDTGRAEYVSITDDEALAAFHECCRIEGIIPALESAHALAYAAKLAATMAKDKILLVNLSGRGDKDMNTVAERSGLDFSPGRSGAAGPDILNRIDATFAKLRAAGRTALIPYVTVGDPSLALDAADHARAGRGRRRRDRARRAVLRSDGRRPGDPARLRARARAGCRPRRTCWRPSPRFAATDTVTPIVLMGYANPIEAMGIDARSPIARATPASTACSSSTIRPRKPASSQRSWTRAASRRSSCSRRRHPRRASPPSRARARLRLLRLAQGRDRRRPSRHGGGRAQARRHPPARDAAGRRRIRHSRRGERAGDRRARRRRRHRQPHHPGDRGGAGGDRGGARGRVARGHPQRARFDAQAAA